MELEPVLILELVVLLEHSNLDLHSSSSLKSKIYLVGSCQISGDDILGEA